MAISGQTQPQEFSLYRYCKGKSDPEQRQMVQKTRYQGGQNKRPCSAVSCLLGPIRLDPLKVSREGRNIPNNSRGCNGHRSIRPQRRMRVSSVVGDLHDDPSPARMNGSRDRSPARNLFCRVDSGGVWVAMGISTNCRSLRDDETRRSALGVILGAHRGRHIVGSGTHPRERRHNDLIRKLDGSGL
jgi:hypothetical protein